MSQKTINFTWEVDGVLTDADAIPTLSDPDATYGVRRNDNNEVVVPAGTVMEQVATGTYRYEFTEPTNASGWTPVGLTYSAFVRVVWNGKTYHFEKNLTSGAAEDQDESTPADEDIQEAIRRAIAANPEGIKSYTINGRTVERMSLLELMRAQAVIQAQTQRREGMFRVIRPRRAR
jgi:hypothetical protein